MFGYNTPVRITRVLHGGSVENLEASCIEDRGRLFFPIRADVEEGDLVEWDLPNGKTKAVRLTSVTHFQSPFGGSAELDHIEADFDTAARPRPVAQPNFDLPGLHASISSASGALYRDGHYRQAVFDAFQAVEHRVQLLTGRSESGRELMGKVFGARPLNWTSPGRRAGTPKTRSVVLPSCSWVRCRGSAIHGDTARRCRTVPRRRWNTWPWPAL